MYKYRWFLIRSRDSLSLVIPNNKTLTAESVVYCNFGINLDEFNISSKTLFTLTFTKDFTYLLKCKVIYLGFKRILQILKNIPQAVFETLDLKHENRCEPH